MLFGESLCLKLGSYDFKGMRECRCHHARYYPRRQFMPSDALELLVEHVVKASESALLYAAGETAAEEATHTLPAKDIHHCRRD